MQCCGRKKVYRCQTFREISKDLHPAQYREKLNVEVIVIFYRLLQRRANKDGRKLYRNIRYVRKVHIPRQSTLKNSPIRKSNTFMPIR